ncbi:MAG: cytochrome c [Actinomycetes bacterium]
MIYGLSTGHQIGLGAAGAIFIVFALLSSFVFPLFNPDFPTKRGLVWYLPLCFIFFFAMMGSVLVFGKESKPVEAEAAATTPVTSPVGKVTTGPYADGDEVAGKAVWNSASCAGCHTFAAAGSTGATGPDLDKQLVTDAADASEPLGSFIAESITDPNVFVASGFSAGMPPYSQTLTQKQIADLVAFVYDSVQS